MWQQGKNIPVTALRNTDVFSSLMKNGVRVCSELITLLILERRLYRFISVTSRGLSGPIYSGRSLEDEKLKNAEGTSSRGVGGERMQTFWFQPTLFK